MGASTKTALPGKAASPPHQLLANRSLSLKSMEGSGRKSYAKGSRLPPQSAVRLGSMRLQRPPSLHTALSKQSSTAQLTLLYSKPPLRPTIHKLYMAGTIAAKPLGAARRLCRNRPLRRSTGRPVCRRAQGRRSCQPSASLSKALPNNRPPRTPSAATPLLNSTAGGRRSSRSDQ